MMDAVLPIIAVLFISFSSSVSGSDTEDLNPHFVEAMIAQSERSDEVLVICPFEERTEILGDEPFQFKKLVSLDAVVVRVLKGELEFGEKMSFSFTTEARDMKPTLGNLMIVFFDVEEEASADVVHLGTGYFISFDKRLCETLREHAGKGKE